MSGLANFSFKRLHRREGEGGVSRPVAETGQKRRVTLGWLLGGLIVLISAYLATAGIVWSDHYHPDEATIAKWIDQVRDEGYITDRAYPSGWFVLFQTRFWLERNAADIVRRWRRHTIQNGKVDALDQGSFHRTAIRDVKDRVDHSIQDGRDFNAWLYVFAALFLYLACLETGQRPAIAFASTLFFTASFGPLEFLHYCETDEALVVSLAFCAWISARAVRKRSVWLILAFGFAAGFAITCKYTLFPLLLLCFTLPFAAFWKTGEMRRRDIALLAVLSVGALAAAAGGYVFGTPALRLAPEWYFETFRGVAKGTYAEIEFNLGGHSSFWSASLFRLVYLWFILLEIGFLTIAWAFFSWSFWFRGDFRRQAFGLPVLLPVFFPFFVFCCPFVRRQETLPLAILFALGGALPLEWALRNKGDLPVAGWKRRFGVAAGAVFGLAALIAGGFRASRTVSCFTLRDTRAEAQNWLHDTVPAAEPIGFDTYVGQSARGVDCIAIHMGGLPYFWEGPPGPQTNGLLARYFVENINFTGRLPIRDLRTGRITETVRKRCENYRSSTLPLRTWTISRDAVPPIFGQPRMRLVAFEQPSANGVDIPIGYSRPLRLQGKGSHLYDADGVAGLGATRAVHTVGKRVSVHVNFDNGPRWLVTRQLSGDDTVRIVREGLFVPRESKLQPGGTVVASLRPNPWERLCAHAAAYSTTRFRMRGDDQSNMCATYLATSVAEAARELRAGGDPAGAVALLRNAGPLTDEARVEAFLAASEAHVPPEAEWEASARKALAACEALPLQNGTADRTSVMLCGVPIGILSDFSRVRTRSQLFVPGQVLPVFLPPGRYVVTLDLSSQFTSRQVPARLFKSQVSDFELTRDALGKECLRAVLDIRKGQLLRVMGSKAELAAAAAGVFPYTPFTGELEISWSPMERTLAVAEELRAALGASSREGH